MDVPAFKPYTKYIKTTVDLDREALDSFRVLYPQRGAVKWFFNAVLASFSRLCTEDVYETIDEAVEEVINNEGIPDSEDLDD